MYFYKVKIYNKLEYWYVSNYYCCIVKSHAFVAQISSDTARAEIKKSREKVRGTVHIVVSVGYILMIRWLWVSVPFVIRRI